MKPNNGKCIKCAVIHNKLRCCMCKWKTEAWVISHKNDKIFVFGDLDNFKARIEGEGEE